MATGTAGTACTSGRLRGADGGEMEVPRPAGVNGEVFAEMIQR
jgi:hypothetical protein